MPVFLLSAYARTTGEYRCCLFGGIPVEPTYLADDINALKEKIDTRHAVTAQILVNEVGDSNPQLFDFSSRWRAPIRAYDYKTSLKRKLERARSDLRILLAVAKEKGEEPRHHCQ